MSYAHDEVGAFISIGLLTAISEAHKFARFEPPQNAPMVKRTWQGIRRKLCTAPRRAEPVLVDMLRDMIIALPEDLRGHRDRALLSVGFAGALRRSELTALKLADISFPEEGLVLRIQKSKTDGEGKGEIVGIPYGGNPITCPVRSLKRWLSEADIRNGFIFRAITRDNQIQCSLSDRSVARIVQKTAKAAGFDPAGFSGHSLRAGLATQAAKAGKTDRAIMRHGRWRSRSTLDRYIRDGMLFEDNVAAGIGL